MFSKNDRVQDIAIVAIGYNRPNSLLRLLNSLKSASYPQYELTLYISLDFNADDDHCNRIAREYDWSYGRKVVIQHSNRLGLRDHVLTCGNLVHDHDGVILLEDDLIVSKYFYYYTCSAANSFKTEPSLAGISLYNYVYNEFSGTGFLAIEDGYDNYFMQVPSSWGQFWSINQWTQFYNFINTEDARVTENDKLPSYVLGWPESSWKKMFFKYIVKNDLYIVYPRESLTTNCGDVGSHFTMSTKIVQVPLQFGKRDYKFSKLQDSLAVYDYTMDLSQEVIKQYNSCFETYDFEVDLSGIKDINKVDKPYLISIKSTNYPIKGFDNSMYPPEANLLLQNIGDFYTLAKTADFINQVSISKFWQKAESEIKYQPTFLIKKGEDNVMQSWSFKIGNAIVNPFSYVINLIRGLFS